MTGAATNTAVFDHPDFDDHEQVVFAADPASGLRAIIAIHDTTLGPALGGCRIWSYGSTNEAIADALRLSRSMTYRAALAGLPLGGGKAVAIIDSDRPKTPAMLRAMGQAIDRLGGRYITAEGAGSTVTDMDEVAKATPFVSGQSWGAGDPAPATARGVFLCMEAAVRYRLGRDLAGIHVAVKGLGSVGRALAGMLHEAGARITVADIDPARVARARQAFGAASVPVGAISAMEADVFAPCALGGDLNERSIAGLRAAIVCGSASNQLATPEDEIRLAEKGVLYCPDYLVNAGGLIHAARHTLDLPRGTTDAHIRNLPETLLTILAEAARTGATPGAVADRTARDRFRPREELRLLA